MTDCTRRVFLKDAGAFGAFAFGWMAALAASGAAPNLLSRALAFGRSRSRQNKLIAAWDAATRLVTPDVYKAYYLDGDTRGFNALSAVERAFDEVVREAKDTVVKGDAPAIWSVYNMGYIVKTRESLFSIDLKHRRAHSLVPLLDFALVTHNHGDHYDVNFCKAMDEAGKPLVSSFVENAAFGEIKAKAAAGGKPDVFKIRDVLIRTFRVDHAKEAWGIDFTTAFEMKIGKFRLLHTGDCGVANDKLRVEWGHPDLWLLFPMTSLDVTDAFKRIRPKRCAFGHIWELSHAVGKGRAIERHIRRGLDMAARAGGAPVVAFWGDRIC